MAVLSPTNSVNPHIYPNRGRSFHWGNQGRRSRKNKGRKGTRPNRTEVGRSSTDIYIYIYIYIYCYLSI